MSQSPNPLRSEEFKFSLNYSDSEILTELNLILSSDLFSRSFVLSSFLRFIVEETLEGRTAGLKEYTIGVSALGKPSDFNPQTDAIVRIHAGRLRRLLHTYYSGIGINDPLKIEVLKGTYAPAFRSHLKEKVESNPPGEISPKQLTRNKLTLGVMPFRNLCAENEFQFFVDGFGEELTRIFSAYADIDVISHHSTRKYISESTDIRDIGSELGAHYLISGSVRRSSEKIRINIGLTEALTGVQIWSKDYTHDLEIEKFMDIQDQIDDDVFALLSGHYGYIVRDAVGLEPDHLKFDIDTFDAVAWNYHIQTCHSLEGSVVARNALETAIQRDPTNHLCLVMLADLYLNSYTLGYPTIENPIQAATELVKKAIRIAPNSQYVNMISGWLNIYLGKKEEAIRALDYSLKLAPASASANGTIGFGFACAGEYQRSHPLLLQAVNLNPHCPWWYYMAFFFIHFQRKQFAEALSYIEKIETSGDVFLTPLLKTAALGELNRISEAKKDVEILKNQFSEILPSVREQLRSFVLDDILVDCIIDGVQKTGLKLS